MIYLNELPVESTAALSTRFQVILSMIEGGLTWLNWAIKDVISPPVYAGNEDQLLTLIQQGLHTEDDIRFNTFRAGISRILTLSEADAEQLSVVRKNGNDNETNLRLLLQRNNIFSYGDIGETADFISSAVSARPDLFQSPSFEDLIALTGLVQQQKTVDEQLKNQACAFAYDKAATIPDFVNLCSFFQEALLHQLPENATNYEAEIQSVYTRLLVPAAYLLFTPNAGTLKDESSLLQAVPELSRANKFIGYSTITSAVLNLVQNINISSQPDQNLQPQIDSYLSAIKTLVSFTPASEYTLSQTGKLTTLRYEKDNTLAMVGVDENGNVFLLPETKININ